MAARTAAAMARVARAGAARPAEAAHKLRAAAAAAVQGELREGETFAVRPVGALTSKPYSFRARKWELISIDSIDIHDACGSHITVQSKQISKSPYDDSLELAAGGERIVRIIPRMNEDINQEFIADKARFAFEGLYKNRLKQSTIRVADGSRLTRRADILLNLLGRKNMRQDTPLIPSAVRA